MVLDASALLALLQNEPGSDAVAAVLPHAVLSAVNLSEVVAKMVERGVSAEDARTSRVPYEAKDAAAGCRSAIGPAWRWRCGLA